MSLTGYWVVVVVNEHPLWWGHCNLARRIEAGWINFLFQVHYSKCFILFSPSLTYPPSLLCSLLLSYTPSLTYPPSLLHSLSHLPSLSPMLPLSLALLLSYPPSFSPMLPLSPTLLLSYTPSLLPSPHWHCLSSSFCFPSLLPCSLFFYSTSRGNLFSPSLSFSSMCIVNCVEWSLFRHSVYFVRPVGTHKWTDGWLHEGQVQNPDCNCQKSIQFSRWVWPWHQGGVA